MTLSVALCTCDGTLYLDEQLTSLRAQDRLPDELVVVDDASQDATLERLQAFAADAPFPVRIEVNPRRLGPVRSFERAIAACRSSVIALCDQDDHWYPPKLGALEAALEASGVLLAFSDGDLIDGSGEPRPLSLWEGVGFRGERRARFDVDPLAALLNRSTVTGCASAFRAELRSAALPFPDALLDERAPMLHDRWLSLVAAATGDVVAIPERLLAYRVHAAQVTGIRRRRGKAHLPGLLLEEASRPVGEVSAAAAVTADQLALLGDAVEAAGAPASAREQIAAAQHHAERRAALHRSRRRRAASVAEALGDGGYRRFGTGAVSAAADLVRPGAGSADDAGEGQILFLNHAANETGPPIVLLAFQRWLIEHTDLAFTTVHGAGGNLLERFEALGPNIVLRHRWSPETVVQAALDRAHRSDGARRIATLAANERLRVALRRTPVDLIYVNALAPVNVMSLRASVARRPGVPVVAHVHEMSVILEHGLHRADLRFALDVADHLVVVSEAVRSNLRERHGVADERMTTVHELIDPPPRACELDAAAAAVRRELGIGDDAPLVVACGSTDWRKAPDLFVRLAWEQRRRRPDLDVTYAWVGNTRNAYEDHLVEFELDRLGLRDVVRFVGVRADPVSWFAAADVFVLPSREDPFPLVCLEAGATGTPIVCFDAGGMPELVEPEEAGVVVPYPDVSAMADAVVALVEDPVERDRLGANAERAVRSQHLTAHLAPRLLEVVERFRA